MAEVVQVVIDWADTVQEAEKRNTEQVQVEIERMQGDAGWPEVRLTGTRQDIAAWLLAHWTDDNTTIGEVMEDAQHVS